MDFETIDGLSEEEIKTLYDVENLKIAEQMCECTEYLQTYSCGGGWLGTPGWFSYFCTGYWNNHTVDVGTFELCRDWCHRNGTTLKSFNSNFYCGGCGWT